MNESVKKLFFSDPARRPAMKRLQAWGHFLLAAGVLILAGCTGQSAPEPTAALPATAPPPAEAACETHDAALALELPGDDIHVGDVFTVTVRLSNPGCLALGLPQYRLQMSNPPETQILGPDPEPIVHNSAVAPGGSDTAAFQLTALSAGTVSFQAGASFEVHVSNPGPAYWSGVQLEEALELEVKP